MECCAHSNCAAEPIGGQLHCSLHDSGQLKALSFKGGVVEFRGVPIRIVEEVRGTEMSPVCDLERLVRPPMACRVSTIVDGLRSRGWPEPKMTDIAVMWGSADAGHVALSRARIYYNGGADQVEHGEIDISDPAGQNDARYIEAIDRLRWVIGLADAAALTVADPAGFDAMRNEIYDDVVWKEGQFAANVPVRIIIPSWRRIDSAQEKCDNCGESAHGILPCDGFASEGHQMAARAAMIRAAGEDPDGPLIPLTPTKPDPTETTLYVPIRWIGVNN